ncbi:MAG: glycosyltransferase family 87 protein [Parvularculaceae bacterium]
MTKRIAAIGAAALLALSLIASVQQFSGVRDNLLPSGQALGGDFIAFHAAAVAAREGAAAEPYDLDAFEPRLKSYVPPREEFLLTWQYPPTYYLLILPLAFFPFALGYAAWVAAGLGVYFGAMRALGVSYFALFVMLASPSALHAVITGQNGFFTAALLGIAALLPDRRPIVAGLAAALLTVKPQLGVLLPIAFAAGGCWRAFGVASAGAALLAVASLAIFGAGAWTAFATSAMEATSNLAEGAMPIHKMATPYSAALLLGAPAAVAATICALFACGAAFAVALVWRRVRDAELRAIALLCGAFMVAPYTYYYELVILALPLALIARRAALSGWLPGEMALIALIFILPMFLPAGLKSVGVSLGFVAAALAALVAVRRVAHEEPHAFRFAIVAPQPQSG